MNNIGHIFTEPGNGLPPVWKMNSGEPYYIRHYDPTVTRDMETLDIMDLQSNLGGLTPGGVELEEQNNDHFFVITNEQSQAVGWVWYYLDPAHPFPAEIAARLGLKEGQAQFFEVSYQKLDHHCLPPEVVNSSTLEPHFIYEERRGVAVSGVRQTLSYLRSITSTPSLAIYAFTDLDNIASGKVLAKNGFTCHSDTVIYDNHPNYFWYKVV